MESIQIAYRHSLKRVIFYTSLCFFFVLVIGFFYGYELSATGSIELGNERFVELLINNEKCLLFLAVGTLSLGIIDVIFLSINAASFGYVIGMAFRKYGWICFLRLLPHAVLEIPAIIAGGIAGFSIPIAMYIYKQSTKMLPRRIVIMYSIKKALYLLLFAAIVMAISCLIEYNISMNIKI